MIIGNDFYFKNSMGKNANIDLFNKISFPFPGLQFTFIQTPV